MSPVGGPILSVALLLLVSASPALANDPLPGGDAGVDTSENGLLVGVEIDTEAEESHAVPAVVSDVASEVNASELEALWVQTEACTILAVSGCVKSESCAGGATPEVAVLLTAEGTPIYTQQVCPDASPSAVTAAPTVTPARVREAFERVPLPESDIMIQPEGGETLVNHPTFLRTEAAPFDETVTFFGGRITVVLHIEPTSFLWHHGDGTTATTTDPGSAYDKSMGLDYGHLVFHEYAKAIKEVAVSVDTTWAATWTLNGRDMGAVPGTVTKTGIPQSLDVLEARPVLVS